jgi:hypothetical protein
MGQPRTSHVVRSPPEYIGWMRRTEGSEPSQYLEEEKTIVIPSVAASERGTAQTGVASATPGLWGLVTWSYKSAV